jgi:flagellar L-ring protein precursor FlgH
MKIARSYALGLAGAAIAGLALGPLRASATDLYAPSNWSAMVSDRAARRVGDSLTVIVYENATAQNTTQTAAQRGTQVGGQLNMGSAAQKNAQLNLNSNFDTTAQASRSGKLVAQITVVVDEVLSNGDLHIAGQQDLDIGGERTKISVKGRVRTADIATDNTVLSTRLADAKIEYDGKGLVSGNAKPSIVSRALSWLGLP